MNNISKYILQSLRCKSQLAMMSSMHIHPHFIVPSSVIFSWNFGKLRNNFNMIKHLVLFLSYLMTVFQLTNNEMERSWVVSSWRFGARWLSCFKVLYQHSLRRTEEVIRTLSTTQPQPCTVETEYLANKTTIWTCMQKCPTWISARNWLYWLKIFLAPSVIPDKGKDSTSNEAMTTFSHMF
jgi:hypothetical protein